jgi:uncharacterized protein (DUF2141 family)
MIVIHPVLLTMKELIALSLLLLLFKSSGAQATVSATVSNFKNNKGICRACIFRDANSFNGKGTPLQCVQAAIQNNTAVFSFSVIPAGSYAVSVFHDANNNNKFDTNFLGIPSEGYGASLNKLPFASAPSFTENKFQLQNTPVQLKIRLRNL